MPTATFCCQVKQLLDAIALARCYTSNAVKYFALEKINVIEGETRHSAAEWQPGLVKPKQCTSIIRVLEERKDLFLQLGWHIESDQNHISLHRKYKTGNPLKRSDVSLHYEEYTYDLVAGIDGEIHQENYRKRQRPWTVRGKNRGTKTYSHLDKAAEVFMEWAELLAPLAK